MENNKKTNYCGSGKKQTDTWFKATINMDKVTPFIEEFKGTKFVRLNINIKDQPDQFEKDVSISIDDFIPEPQQEKPSQAGIPRQVLEDEIGSDDLPF